MTIIRMVLVDPIIVLLRFLFTELHAVTGNYGVSLVLLSLAVTLLTTPLYYLAEHWRRIEVELQRRMAPELASVRAHYTGQKRFYLTRNVHRLHRYSPWLAVRASLGLLVQIPFFFAAFFYLSHYEGYVGTGFLFLKDLGRPDALLGPLNLLPILMTAINVASALVYTRSLTLKGSGPLLLMSLLFLVLLWAEPAALLVYWTMNNIFSLAKNIFLPAPKSPAVSPAIQGPGLAVRSVTWVRALYGGSLAWPLLAAGTMLLVSAQSWWLLHHASSYSRVIAASFALAGLVSLAALVTLWRTPRTPGTASRALAVFVSWIPFAISAYFLFFQRRQNAYVSNPNLKMLTTLLLDACALIAAAVIVSRHRGTRPPEPRDTGGTAAFVSGAAYLSLFLFILSPLQIYFSSPQDVGFTPWELMGRNMAPFLAVTVGLAGLGFLARRGGRGFPGGALLAAIVVALVYALSSSRLYGVLDEFALQRAFVLDESPAWLYLLDVLVVLAAAILGRYVWRRKRRLVIPVLSIFAIAGAIQAASAATRTPAAELLSDTRAPSAALPEGSAEAHRFSRTGRNVVVVIADMFNGNYLGKTLEEFPRYRDLLDGFTWYPDTLSVSSVTAASLPGIYGGWDFAPRRMNATAGTGTEKIRKAAERFFGGIARKGYAITAVDSLYADLVSPSGVLGPGGAVILRSDSYTGYWQAHRRAAATGRTVNRKNALLSMLTIFHSVPFSLKPEVYDNGSWILFRESYQFDYIARRTLATYGYLDLLPELSSVTETGNTFKFIHTQFTHEPFGVAADGSIISGSFPDARTRSFVDGTSAYYTARTFVEFLSRWVSWMKSSGVYDNTMIIVISDHGNNAHDNGLPLPAALRNPFATADLSRAYPLLLVKPFGARGTARVDPRLVSNADTAAILFHALGDSQAAAADPTATADPPPRTLEYGALQNDWEEFLLNGKAEFTYYQVRGSMFDPANWSRK